MPTRGSPTTSAELVRKETPETARTPGKRSGAKAVILSGLAAIVVLLVAGLIVQRTLPEPFQLTATMKLPASVASAEAVFSDSGRVYDNTPVWWVNRSGDSATLRYFDPATEEAHFATRFRPVDLPGTTSYDTGFWNPIRVPALFEIHQATKRLYVFIRRSDNGAIVRGYSVPIGAPEFGVYRSFEVGYLDGPRSDLFSIDRGLENTRVRLGVFSGESGFKFQVFATYLPFRGLGPRKWSLGTGELGREILANGKQAPPSSDIMLVQRDPDREHANLKVLPGEKEFGGFAYQWDIDEPGDLPSTRVFLTGSWRGTPSIFEVVPEAAGGPQLRIFDLRPPGGLL